MNLQAYADAAASAGRYGDTTLVHMSPDEVAALDNLALYSGIGALPRNPYTGYPEAFSLGKLFKGIGSIAAGALGTAFLGPLGGALASGLFTGATEKNLKKGLLAGMTAFAGGKALDAVSKAGQATKAASEIGMQGATSDTVSSLAGTLGPRRGWDYFRDLGSAAGSKAGVQAGLEGAGSALTSGKMPFMLYPMMGEVSNSIEQDRLARYGDAVTRQRALAVEQANRDYESMFGRNPYASMYASRYNYASGGLVDPIDDGIMRMAGGGMIEEGRDVMRDMEANPTKYMDNGLKRTMYELSGKSREARDRAGPTLDPRQFSPHLQSNAPPQGYVPGYMPEFMYLTPQGMRPQNPAGMSQPMGSNPFDMSGIAAILNQGQGQFLRELGYNPPVVPPRSGPPGSVPNPRGGMGDMVPAMVSPGEYVVPADVVAHLGDGDTRAGAGQLEAMNQRIRTQKTGSPMQLPPVDLRQMAY